MTNNLFCAHNGQVKPHDKLVNSETCPNRTPLDLFLQFNIDRFLLYPNKF